MPGPNVEAAACRAKRRRRPASSPKAIALATRAQFEPAAMRLSSTDNRRTIRGCLERLPVACGGTATPDLSAMPPSSGLGIRVEPCRACHSKLLATTTYMHSAEMSAAPLSLRRQLEAAGGHLWLSVVCQSGRMRPDDQALECSVEHHAIAALQLTERIPLPVNSQSSASAYQWRCAIGLDAKRAAGEPRPPSPSSR